MTPTPSRPRLRVDLARVVIAGTALWALGLLVTLLVPALRTGDRGDWPLTCAAGVVLGLVGHAAAARLRPRR